MVGILPNSIKYATEVGWFMNIQNAGNINKSAWSFKINPGTNDLYFYVPDGSYGKFTKNLINDIRDNTVSFPIWQCLSPMFAYFQLVTLTEEQKQNKEESLKLLINNTMNEFKKYTILIDQIKEINYAHIYYACDEYVFIIYPYLFVYEELARLIHNEIKNFILSPLNILPLVPETKSYEICRSCLCKREKMNECLNCLGSGKGRIIEYKYQYSFLNNEKYIDENDKIRIGLIHTPFNAKVKINDEVNDFPALDGTIVKEYWEPASSYPHVPIKKREIEPFSRNKKPKYSGLHYELLEEKVNDTLKENGLIYGDDFKIDSIKSERNRNHIYNIKMTNSRHSIFFSIYATGQIKVDIEKKNKKFKEKEIIKKALESMKNIPKLNSSITYIDDIFYIMRKRKKGIDKFVERKKNLEMYKNIISYSIYKKN